MDGPNQGHTHTSPQSGRIPPKVNTTVHKVDRHNQGQTYKSTKWNGPHQGSTPPSKKWTDPTRVKLIQVHKVDGSHQGLTPPFTKWTDPTRVKLIQVQKVDGPNKGQTYITPKKRTDPTNVQNPNTHNGRTQPVHKII